MVGIAQGHLCPPFPFCVLPRATFQGCFRPTAIAGQSTEVGPQLTAVGGCPIVLGGFFVGSDVGKGGFGGGGRIPPCLFIVKRSPDSTRRSTRTHPLRQSNEGAFSCFVLGRVSSTLQPRSKARGPAPPSIAPCGPLMAL